MERDSIKWLIAGLAGALFTLLLFIGVGVAIFMRMEKSAPEESLASIFDDIHLDVSDEEEAAREEEEERKEAERRAKQEAENAADPGHGPEPSAVSTGGEGFVGEEEEA